MNTKNTRIFYYIPICLLCSLAGNAFAQSENSNDNPAELKAVSPTYDYAYGVREKSMLTGAVSFINSNTISESPSSSIDKSMQGRLSGVTIMRNSDEPGYENSSIYIRGIGTFGEGKEPLIMVDGVESDYYQLIPEEIEKITVLKDGAATVLYGIRGANGVILINTKRGINGKPIVTLNAQFGLQNPIMYPKYLGSQEYLMYRNIALANDGLAIPTDDRNNPAMYDGINDPYSFANTDWYGEMLRNTAPQQRYNVSLQGGTDKVRYFVLLGATNQQGIYKHSKVNPNFNTNVSFSGYNVRSNVDMQASRELSIRLDLSARVEQRNTPMTGASDIFTALSTIPSTIPMFNRDGSLGGNGEYKNNPYGLITQTGYGRQNSRYLSGNIVADYDLQALTKGLSVDLQMSFNTFKHYGRKKDQSFAVYSENSDGSFTKFGEDTDISLAYDNLNDRYFFMYSIIGGFNYDRVFGCHHLNGALKGLLSSKEINGNSPDFKQQNLFGYAAYQYDNRYTVEFGFSYSGSEDFIGKNRYGFFPVGSFAWNISNEQFMQNVSTVNFLKLRGSYGMVGNSNLGIGRFPSDPRYFPGGGYWFGGSQSESDGAYEGSISNPNITWEKSLNGNVGLDIELLNSRLTASMDAFYNKRSRIISYRTATLPDIIGQVLPLENIGKVDNKGFEVTLGFNDSKGDFRYGVNTNISFARNTIKAYDEVAGLNSWEYRSGHSVTQQWGLEVLGFFSSYEEINQWAKSSYSKLHPGDIKYTNLNGDGIIDQTDEKPIGKPLVPEWTGGLNLMAGYKGFDLNIFFTGVANRTIFVNNNVFWGIQGNNKATNTVKDAWQAGVNEATARYPRLTTLTNNHNYRKNSLWAFNGDYLRLQNIELGYSLPKLLLSKAHISKTRFFVNASNLFSFDRLHKYNVNVENIGSGITTYPQMRIFNVGVSLQF